MVQQVTKGIKISVRSEFIGTSYRNYQLYYGFRYHITIENQSNDSVQLLHRHWKIFDSLNPLEIVEGPGVVGKKPVIKPKESHSYSSQSFITSPIGSMKGYFKMINFTSSKTFKVIIPTFQLMVSSISN